VSGLRIGPIAQVGDAEAIADSHYIASQAFEQMTDPQKSRRDDPLQ
jgi:hypothetical protein